MADRVIRILNRFQTRCVECNTSMPPGSGWAIKKPGDLKFSAYCSLHADQSIIKPVTVQKKSVGAAKRKPIDPETSGTRLLANQRGEYFYWDSEENKYVWKPYIGSERYKAIYDREPCKVFLKRAALTTGIRFTPGEYVGEYSLNQDGDVVVCLHIQASEIERCKRIIVTTSEVAYIESPCKTVFFPYLIRNVDSVPKELQGSVLMLKSFVHKTYLSAESGEGAGVVFSKDEVYRLVADAKYTLWHTASRKPKTVTWICSKTSLLLGSFNSLFFYEMKKEYQTEDPISLLDTTTADGLLTALFGDE